MKRTKIIAGFSLEDIEKDLNEFYDELAENKDKAYKIDDVDVKTYVKTSTTEDEWGKPTTWSRERFYAVVNYTILG